MKMKIKSINWLSESAQEAEVIVTDGTHFLTAFCHPCEFSEGDELNEPLNIFDAKHIMRTNERKCIIEQINNQLDAFIIAKLTDPQRGICTIGNMKMMITDYIPTDIKAGELIQFGCGRIDT